MNLASGSPKFKSLVTSDWDRFGVSRYAEPTERANGDMGSFASFGPSIQLIQATPFYHSDHDTLQTIPRGDFDGARASLVIAAQNLPQIVDNVRALETQVFSPSGTIGAMGHGDAVTGPVISIADNLVQRGFATITRDASDSRQLNVSLTPAGLEYARALTEVIAELNREVAIRASPEQLRATDSVLRAILFDDSTRQRATWLPTPQDDPAQPR